MFSSAGICRLICMLFSSKFWYLEMDLFSHSSCSCQQPVCNLGKFRVLRSCRAGSFKSCQAPRWFPRVPSIAIAQLIIRDQARILIFPRGSAQSNPWPTTACTKSGQRAAAVRRFGTMDRGTRRSAHSGTGPSQRPCHRGGGSSRGQAEHLTKGSRQAFDNLAPRRARERPATSHLPPKHCERLFLAYASGIDFITNTDVGALAAGPNNCNIRTVNIDHSRFCRSQ